MNELDLKDLLENFDPFKDINMFLRFYIYTSLHLQK